jgi:hypothetical protein
VHLVAAAKVIPFVERKPATALPDEIPLPRHWSHAQWDDFERRLREDAACDPHFYGPAFLQAVGVPWPTPRQADEGRPPSDRWFAEIDSKIDQRRHERGPKPWDAGERERLSQTPFYPDELAGRRVYERPNGEDPDPAA